MTRRDDDLCLFLWRFLGGFFLMAKKMQHIGGKFWENDTFDEMFLFIYGFGVMNLGREGRYKYSDKMDKNNKKNLVNHRHIGIGNRYR